MMKSSVLWLAATNCCLSAALRMDGQQNLDDQHNDHAIMLHIDANVESDLKLADANR